MAGFLFCSSAGNVDPYNKVIIVGDINIHIYTDNGLLGITSMSLPDSVSFETRELVLYN